jgi:hypothetical protein
MSKARRVTIVLVVLLVASLANLGLYLAMVNEWIPTTPGVRQRFQDANFAYLMAGCIAVACLGLLLRRVIFRDPPSP